MRKIAVPISFRSISKSVAGGAIAVYFSGCVTPPPPYEDYTIARSAVQAAQEVDAPRFSAGLWAKADENYRKGEKAWREFEFEDAKKYFKNAISFAEKAEDATRLKKFESGDSFP
jgi:hypothetical protein